ncbi:FUN14 domain-containing protein 1-like isoform X1 [Pecten maximus]|uniref:FUN14 domain-containing protein 1-like isoform X1 n=1 Tax=Pecten maximus TaxID=6579 RepID=UPI001458F969|nr:FUN14 domain-containing protein 1-like isoform X1 [Pecten maximus]
MADNNEPFEVLDLEAIRRGNSWLQKVFGDISKQSAAKQVAIGGATGWVSGYLFVKVGKIAAATLGTTIILVQIAQYKGYIQINWKKVQKEMSLAKNQMSKEISKKYPSLLTKHSDLLPTKHFSWDWICWWLLNRIGILRP